jgi:hypothetical protein
MHANRTITAVALPLVVMSDQIAEPGCKARVGSVGL